MDAFDVIFTTYSPIVFRYLRSLSGDAAVAEELTAETFYRAYTHFDSFRGDSKLETWLCAIAKNAYLKDCLRALCAVLGVLLAVFLVLIGKTFVILGQPGGAASAALPAGATDLAACEVSGTAEEVGTYVFATGTARLVVAADALPDAPVTVRLWQVRGTRENTMVATLDAKQRSCVFTNLPPQTLYAVTVDGAPDVQLTVRSRLTFREAFSLMLQEL